MSEMILEVGECDATDMTDADRRKWDEIAKANSEALEQLSTRKFSVEIVKGGVPIERTTGQHAEES